jgi:hypothetical protein
LIQALKIQQQKLGENHPETVISLDNLASLYCLQQRYSEAERTYLQVLRAMLKTLGEDHPETQICSQNFIYFLVRVIQENRTTELSDHPLTRLLLQDLQTGAL